MAKKHVGRKKGGHNRGYFYRAGRGWYVVDGSRFQPLRYEDGTAIKAAGADERDVRAAHARWLLDRQASPILTPVTSEVTVLDVCQTYLTNAKATGAAKTHADRADTLFDFCFGLPPEFRPKKEGA